MSIPGPQKLNIDGNEALSRVQDSSATTFRAILAKEILDGVLLTDVALVTGSVNSVPHGLGRVLTGWIPARVRAQSTLWDSQASNGQASSTLALNCSANVTVDLWVF